VILLFLFSPHIHSSVYRSLESRNRPLMEVAFCCIVLQKGYTVSFLGYTRELFGIHVDQFHYRIDVFQQKKKKKILVKVSQRLFSGSIQFLLFLLPCLYYLFCIRNVYTFPFPLFFRINGFISTHFIVFEGCFLSLFWKNSNYLPYIHV